MDYSAVLTAKVAIDGIAKANAELAAFNAELRKSASVAGSAGGDLDKISTATRGLGKDLTAAHAALSVAEADLRKTARAADGSSGALRKTSTAARGLDGDLARARTTTKGFGADLDRSRQSSDNARGGLEALGATLGPIGDELRRIHADAANAGTGLDSFGRDLRNAHVAADEASASAARLRAEVAKGIRDDQYAHLTDRIDTTRQALDTAGTSLGGFGDDLRRVQGAASVARGGLSPFSDELARARDAAAKAGEQLGDTSDDADDLSTGLSRAQRIIADANAQLAKTGVVSSSTQAELRNLASRGVGGLDADMDRMRSTVARAREELASTGSVSRRTRRDLDNLGGGAGGAGGGLAALSGGLAGLPGGVGALGAAAAFTVPVLIGLGGAAVAVGSALGPLVGLAGSAAVGLTAAAQGFGVLKLATSGIADALREQTTNQDAAGQSAVTSGNQQRAAAKAIAAAQEGVRQARMGVADAVRRVEDAERTYGDSLGGLVSAEREVAQAMAGTRTAQLALTDARRAARQQIVDTRSALTDALLGEERATFALRDARDALAAMNAGPSARALADAHESITDAVRAERSALSALQDAHRSVGDALRGEERAVLSLGDAHDRLNALLAGPDPADLADAGDSVADAMRDEERAAFGLLDAQRALADLMANPRASAGDIARARLDLADAENAVGDAARATTRARERLAELQKPPSERELAKARLDVADAEDAVRRASDATAKARHGVEEAENGVGDAQRATADARQALVDLERPASSYDLAKARHAVREAEKGLADAIRHHSRAAVGLLDVEARGIGQSEMVIDARRGITAANEQVLSAQEGVNDAMRAAQDAARGVTDAERDLVEANRQVTRALHGVDDAQLDAASSAAGAAVGARDLNRAMDALPAPAQAFVRTLADLKPKLDDLRATAAAGFFPGAREGLLAAARSFEPVKTVVDQTARVLGGLAARAGELVGSKAWGTDIAEIGRRNAGIMGTLGDAGLHIADALRHVLVAAGPLTTWLAKSTEAWARNVEQSAKAGRESGKMAAFFDRTRAVLRRLVSIVGNVAGGLLGIGKAGSRSGNEILRSIDAAARRFNEWANSVAGRREIQQFFEDCRRLADALIPVIAGAAKGVAALALRFEPLIVGLRLLGPLADEAILAFVGFKAAMTAAGFVRALSGALVFLAANPIVAAVLAVGALGFGLYELYQHSEKFREIVDSLGKVVKSAFSGWDTAGLVDDFNSIKDAARKVFDLISGIAKRTLPGVAQMINGFATEIRGVIEVVSGLINGDFRKMWEGIKHIFSGAINVVIGYVRALTAPVREVAARIGGALIGALSDAADGAVGFFAALPGRIIDALKGAPDLLVKTGGWMGEQIIGGFKGVGTAVTGAGSWFFDKLESGIKGLAGALKAAGGWVRDRVSDGFKVLGGALPSVGPWLKDRVVAIVQAHVDSYRHVGEWILARVSNGFKTVTDALSTVGGWLKNQIVGLVHATIEDLGQLGRWVLNRVVDGFKSGTELLGTVGGWLKNQLVSLVHATVEDLGSLGRWILNRVVDGIQAVTRVGGDLVSGPLSDAAKWIFHQLKNLLSGLKDGFLGLGGDIISWIVSGLKDGAIKVQDFLNKIVGVINRLPGVSIPDINVIQRAEGGTIGGSGVQHFATGGEVRRGTVINKPMIMMGEEAPCIAYGTPIETAVGRKPIQDIEAGEFVLTRNGYREVLWSGITRRDTEVLRITSVDGDSVVCTPDHRIWTADGGIGGDRGRDCLGGGDLRGGGVLSHHQRPLEVQSRHAGVADDRPGHCAEIPGRGRFGEGPYDPPAYRAQDDLQHRRSQPGGRGAHHPGLSAVAREAATSKGAGAAYPHRDAQRRCGATQAGLQARPPMDARVDVCQPARDQSLPNLQARCEPRVDAAEAAEGPRIQRAAERGVPRISARKAVGSRVRSGAEQAPARAPRACWREAGELNVGDWVWTLDDEGRLTASRISSIEPAERVDVYDLTVDADHEFVAGGILVHNCHPEFVIPTNPAYRDRAHMLLGQAARATGFMAGGVTGFAVGGVIDERTLQGMVSTFGPPTEGAGNTASGLSSAEPGLALNLKPGTDYGWNNWMTDALVAKRQKFILSIPGYTANPTILPVIDKGPAGWTDKAIDVTGAGVQAAGLNPFTFPTGAIGTVSAIGDLPSRGSGGLIEAVGNAIGDAGSAVGGAIKDVAGIPVGLLEQGAGWILNQLPNPADMLPAWLHGLGEYVIDGVTGWVKNKVGELIPGGGGTSPGGAPGDGTPAAVQFAKMVAKANAMESMQIPYGPQGHTNGWAINQLGEDCSSTVSKILHAAGFLSSVLDTTALPSQLASGPGRWVTVHDRALPGNDGHTIIQLGDRFFGTSSSNPGGGPGWTSPDEGYLATMPTKLHPTGLAMGGILGGLPFGGSFLNGGVVPGPLGAPTGIIAHGGEIVTPAGGGGDLASAIRELRDEIRDMKDGFGVEVYMDGREITDRVEVAFRRHDRRSHGVLRAGVGR